MITNRLFKMRCPITTEVIVNKYYLIAYILYAFPNFLFGQYDIIPPAPNSASLGFYADVPVSLYTGIPSITLPLYNIKSGSLEVPISISYHASGIKVFEEASWVGLGWSFNAGGIITRQVRGSDDLSGNGYLNYGALPPCTAENNPDFSDQSKNAEYIDYYRRVSSGEIDGEPDVFYYNINGYTGKFVFEKGGSGDEVSPIVLYQNNFKITFYINTYTFEIIDDKGFKYTLGTKEQTLNYSSTTSTRYMYDVCYENEDTQSPVITAWYLDKIESPQGDVVSFYYNSNSYSSISQVQRSEIIMHCLDFTLLLATGRGYIPPYGLSNEMQVHGANMQEVSDVSLERITFNSGSIIFSTSSRNDIGSRYSEPQKLDYFIIRDEELNPFKRVDFHYDYFNNNSSSKDLRRLKLDSLTISNEGVSLPSYEFIYNDVDLPAKTSYSIDHWGFYNGKDNSNVRYNYNYFDVDPYFYEPDGFWITENTVGYTKQTLIPYLEQTEGGKNLFFTGANRNPDIDYAKAATLIKVKYPTGGTTEYDYESNTYVQYGNMYKENEKNYSVLSNISASSSEKEKSFSLNGDTFVFIDYYFISNNQSSYSFTDVVAYLATESGNRIIEYKPGSLTFSSYDGIYLPAGNYKIFVDCPSYPSDLQSLKVKFIEKESVSEMEGGGLRIKSILSKNANGDPLLKKSYLYENSDGTSSGKTMTPLKYSYKLLITEESYAMYTSNIVHYVYQGLYLVRPANSIIPLGSSANGNPVGYDRVTELTTSSNDSLTNGKAVYYYHNCPDLLSSGFMPDLPTRTFPQNGMLRKLEYYNDNGKVVKTQENTYEPVYSSEIKVKGLKTYRIPSTSEVDYGNAGRVKFYDVYSDWWKLTSETTKIYSSGEDNDYIEQTKNYSYDVTHKLVTSIETNSSDNSTLTTDYTYPTDIYIFDYDDLSSQGQAIKKMVTDNIISNPVQVIHNKDGNVTKGDYTTYIVTSSGKIAPEIVYAMELDSSLVSYTQPYIDFNGEIIYDGHFKESIYFDKHDSKANVLQLHKKNDIASSFVWGYNGSFPIVVAEGIDYDSFLELLDTETMNQIGCDFLDFFDDPSLFSENIYRTIINNVRQSNSGIRINNYTYSPLEGMTSQTDPNGNTTYYEYDSFGRLKNVRDNDGKIIARNYYHYYNDTSSDTPYLNTSPTSMSFGSGSSASSLSIISNTIWTITDNATWLSVNTTSGTGNATITVSVTANTSAARNATITITYAGGLTKTVSVSQAAGSTSTLLVSPLIINYGSIAPLVTVTVTSNTSWTVTKSASWITISATSGTGNGTITVRGTKLLSGTRSGTVTIKTTDNTVTRIINIYQDSGLIQQ